LAYEYETDFVAPQDARWYGEFLPGRGQKIINTRCIESLRGYDYTCPAYQAMTGKKILAAEEQAKWLKL
jgi:hypothetical protein